MLKAVEDTVCPQFSLANEVVVFLSAAARPRSAMLKAVEDKVASILVSAVSESEGESNV